MTAPTGRRRLFAAFAVGALVVAWSSANASTGHVRTMESRVTVAPVVGEAAVQLDPANAASCDQAEALFAAMFAALTAQALANAGKTQGDLEASLGASREVFERYLAAVGIGLDAAQLEALTMGFGALGEAPGTC